MINEINDEIILAARVFLATLFLIFGWRKLRDYPGTVSQMVQDGVPAPVLEQNPIILYRPDNRRI